MALHKLTMVERKPGGVPAPHPSQCQEHHKAGRMPIYYGTRLVAYVDQIEDLPQARLVKRDGRLIGEVTHWE